MEDKSIKKTKIINFIAGAGAGKSTMCAGVFSKLKMNGVDCELSSEYAKELVWESRNETFKDEVYIFAKQNHRLFRLNGKVDVVITDRPLIMSNIYNKYYNPDRKEFNKIFEDFVKANWNMYDNVNIFINRVKEYNPNGRNETLEQALELDTLFKNYLDTNKIDYICVDGNEKGLDDAVNYIIGILDKEKIVNQDCIEFINAFKKYESETILNKIISNGHFDVLFNDFSKKYEYNKENDLCSLDFFFNEFYSLDNHDWFLWLADEKNKKKDVADIKSEINDKSSTKEIIDNIFDNMNKLDFKKTFGL